MIRRNNTRVSYVCSCGSEIPKRKDDRRQYVPWLNCFSAERCYV